MLFHSRVLYMAKDTAYADEYEDAFASNGELGRAAIADGVASSIFSAAWGQILTAALVEQPPDLTDGAAFGQWLADCRAAWLASIDLPRLGYHQREKLKRAGGAFCTLCWVTVTELPQEDSRRKFRALAYALGDSCLFHIRQGAVLRMFPLQTAAEFDLDPMSLCSIASSRDESLEFATLDLECEEGDLLLLCTDAISKWMMTELEAGMEVPWSKYAIIVEADWMAEIESHRSGRRMRRDDSTLVLLSVGCEPAVAPEDSLSADAGGEASGQPDSDSLVNAVQAADVDAAEACDTAEVDAPESNVLPADADEGTTGEPTAEESAASASTNGQACEGEETPDASAGPVPKASSDLDSLLEEESLGA